MFEKQEAFNILHSVQDEVTLHILKYSQCPLELQLEKYLIPKELNDNTFEFKDHHQNIFESTRIELDDQLSKRTQQIRKIILIKKEGSLGFSLTKIENEGFYVKQILKEPASLERINPGDRILSVNGTSLDGLGN